MLDFYHVCRYIGKMADALFGPETPAAAQWFAKMRRWLRERPHGAAQVSRSALQHLDHRTMTKAQQAEFWKAYRYLRRHRRCMDYRGYRQRGLPIGSGVTEAACKTVFTQRFKRSGMRWRHDTSQIIVDLRVIYLSGSWDDAVAAQLTARELPEPAQQGVLKRRHVFELDLPRNSRCRSDCTRPIGPAGCIWTPVASLRK